MAAQKVIIDTDPATGNRFRDVDDGLAMLYLLALPDEFDVVGVTAVHGNASLAKTYPKALEVVEVSGREDIPVLSGASSRKLLGAKTAASEFLAGAVRSNPGEITVLALGPLTNVATAGLIDGDFYESVRRVVIMGGTFTPGPGMPLSASFEFNFSKDPAASGLVLSAPCEKVLIPANLCRQSVFTRDNLAKLREMHSRVSEYLAERITPWMRLNEAVLMRGAGGFVPWDVVAAVYLRRPDLFGDVEEKPLVLRGHRYLGGGLEEATGSSAHPVIFPNRLSGKEVVAEFLTAISGFSDSGRARRAT